MRTQRARGRWAAFLVLSLAALSTAGAARAQSGGPYELRWSSIDAGGATALVGGDYGLGGTSGQPDAGAMHGGPWALLGGFWEAETFAVGVPGEDPGDTAPALAFRLHAAVPNPFNPSTQLAFDLPQAGPVRLAVYDLRGALVRLLADGPLPAGRQVAVWDGRDDAGRGLASGVYFIRLDAGGRRAQQKALLLK
jgi:hypothetical protein